MKNHIVTIILMITCMLSLSGCKDKETNISYFSLTEQPPVI